MEKRYILFIVLTVLILMGYARLQMWLNPPLPVDQENQQHRVADIDNAPARALGDNQEGAAEAVASREPEPGEGIEPGETNEVAAEAEQVPAEKVAPERVTMGSVAPDSRLPFLVTFTNQGAAIERIELSSTQYQSLGSLEYRRNFGHAKYGYLGNLALVDAPTGDGCQVQVVGHGTPAALAKCNEAGVPAGLRRGDTITAVNGEAIADAKAMIRRIRQTQPGETIEFSVVRLQEDQTQSLSFTADLRHVPLQVVRPEPEDLVDGQNRDPLSFLMTLQQIGNTSVPTGADEITGISSLKNSHWKITQRPSVDAVDAGESQEIEFTLEIGPDQMEGLGQTGRMVIVRRYRLEQPSGDGPQPYHLTMSFEIQNQSDHPKKIAYRMDGPTGLPLEGWWYLYKVHPKMFKRAGARDVVWRPNGASQVLYGNVAISKQVTKKNERSTSTPMMNDPQGVELGYAGVDTQYFAAMLLPEPDASKSRPIPFSSAVARPVGHVDKKYINKSNVSFRLISTAVTVKANESLTQSFRIFAGPKDPEILASYALGDTIIYGWFWFVAKPMIKLLHFFGGVGNFGIAIILLTVLVRGGMFPLGRRQAQMAAKMQELAPEMKEIAEKYKNDMEKKTKSQQELFKKHNCHPLSSCLPMLLQLPIFIGLYRALSVDIRLRGAPLIPGSEWCANLAAPDMLWYWEQHIPAFLSAPTGWLGPYLNVLPLVTIVFFMVHQKLFTPPATDENTAMQQKMMKFMLVFMGFIFFKVAAGLCLYIIASSAWGVAERLLLPKPKPRQDTGNSSADRKTSRSSMRPATVSSGNGSPNKKTGKGRRKSKGRR